MKSQLYHLHYYKKKIRCFYNSVELLFNILFLDDVICCIHLGHNGIDKIRNYRSIFCIELYESDDQSSDTAMTSKNETENHDSDYDDNTAADDYNRPVIPVNADISLEKRPTVRTGYNSTIIKGEFVYNTWSSCFDSVVYDAVLIFLPKICAQITNTSYCASDIIYLQWTNRMDK